AVGRALYRGRRFHMTRKSASKLKRVYEEPEQSDGTRVLVDRVWPRGLTKDRAAIDVWLKEVAPSTELRKWFGHDPERWEEFRRRYREELAMREGELEKLRELEQAGLITLLYGARDEAHNQAVVLQEMLQGSDRK